MQFHKVDAADIRPITQPQDRERLGCGWRVFGRDGPLSIAATRCAKVAATSTATTGDSAHMSTLITKTLAGDVGYLYGEHRLPQIRTGSAISSSSFALSARLPIQLPRSEGCAGGTSLTDDSSNGPFAGIQVSYQRQAVSVGTASSFK
jgi:hypothetical protein